MKSLTILNKPLTGPGVAGLPAVCDFLHHPAGQLPPRDGQV